VLGEIKMSGKDDIEKVLKLYTDQMDAQITRFNEIVIKQSVAIGTHAVNMSRLERTVSEEVLPVIKEIPGLIEHGIKIAQDTCPLYKAWDMKEKESESNKLGTLFDSKPPTPNNKKKFILSTNLKIRLIEALIFLILSVAAWFGISRYNEPFSVTDKAVTIHK
jgi:hypothetical protein